MYKLEELSLDIEELRQEMHGLIEKEQSITSLQIINISQELDKLINEYSQYYERINSLPINEEENK